MQHVSRTPPSVQNQTIDQKLLFQMQLFHKILRIWQKRLFQISTKLKEKPTHIDCLANFRGKDFFHLIFESLILTSNDPEWPAILVKFSWSKCKQCDCSYLAAFCKTWVPFSIPLKEKQNIGNWSHPKSVIFYES